MPRKMPLMRRIVFVAVLSTAAAAVSAEYAWPEQVARIEDMVLLTPMRFSVPSLRAKGDVRGPAVLRVHVDKEGQVLRVALLESCGSPAHDEAAIYAMREMRFRPKQFNGEAVDVTLVVPLHLPIPKYPSRP